MNGALCYWTIIKNSSASAFGGHSITDQKRKGQFFFSNCHCWWFVKIELYIGRLSDLCTKFLLNAGRANRIKSPQECFSILSRWRRSTKLRRMLWLLGESTKGGTKGSRALYDRAIEICDHRSVLSNENLPSQTRSGIRPRHLKATKHLFQWCRRRSIERIGARIVWQLFVRFQRAVSKLNARQDIP